MTKLDQANYILEREAAREELVQQAKRMRKISDTKFPAVHPEATVRVPVPDVDRAKIDYRSISARVLRKKENDLYELGTKSGCLQQLYSRSQFSVCSEKFIDEADVPSSSRR